MPTRARMGQPMIKGRAPRSAPTGLDCVDTVQTGENLAPLWDGWVSTHGTVVPRRLNDSDVPTYGVWTNATTSIGFDSPATTPLLIRGWFTPAPGFGNGWVVSTANPNSDTYHVRCIWNSDNEGSNSISLNARIASLCSATGANSEEFAIIPCVPGSIVTVSAYVSSPDTPVAFGGVTTPAARITLTPYTLAQSPLSGVTPSYTVLSSTYVQLSTTMVAPASTAYITASVTFLTTAWAPGGPNESANLTLDLADVRVSVS